MDHTACALDALEGVVGLEHVAQRLQALHLAAIADLVLGQAEDRNAIASRGDDVCVQKASTFGQHSDQSEHIKHLMLVIVELTLSISAK